MNDQPNHPEGSLPDAPEPKFPLYRHKSGQWAKKIKGRLLYFGTNKEAALHAYNQLLERQEKGEPSRQLARTPRTRKSADRPYAEFPLFRHRNGQWAKNVKGRMHYFGINADEALRRWNNEGPDLLAGRTPQREDGTNKPTIRNLANQFLNSKRSRISTGELSRRTFSDYYATCSLLVDFFGPNKRLDELRPNDFMRLRDKLAKTNGPIGLSNSVQRIRTVLHFAFDEMDVAIKFGRKSFCKVSQKVLREERRKRGSRMIEADELRKIIHAARGALKPMALLGINCGFGQSDLAALPLSALDLEGGWVNYPRPKTAIDRRVPLWPETVAAIRDYLADRPTPTSDEDKDLVFITKYGRRFIRVRESTKGKKIKINDQEHGRIVVIDGISQEFRKLLHELNLKRAGNFYNLRHVHRTVADTTKDQPACDAIMGHAPESEDMSSRYREKIDDDRLLAVTNAIRGWLKPGQVGEPGPATIPFKAIDAG
jgi:integrase